MSETILRLEIAGDAERSEELTRELLNEITQLRGVTLGSPKKREAAPGSRGDPVTLLAIALAAVSSGGAITALVGTIGSYLSRDRRTELIWKRPDGSEVHLTSQSFKPEQVS